MVPGALFLALAVLGLLFSGPARAAFMMPGGTIRPKDFSLVKKDGYYHLFFIRHNTALPISLTETDFGHARSNDLYHWTILPPVFPVRPDDWDNRHVWAPHIFQRDGLWWMFYTGVTESAEYNQTQRTGVAVSADLETWNRLDGPIFDASQTPWGWWSPGSWNPGFRDPFVMPDPALPGGWLMYYTASYGPDTAATVVGVAASDGDFTQWRDVKPLLITWQQYTYNTLTESPHVFEHNGLYYLFLSTNAGQPLSFYTSNDPVGDPGQWTYRGRLRNMLGFDTTTWFASEHFKEGTRDLFCFINGDRVEIREIRWSAGWEFTLVQPPLMHVLAMNWVYPMAYSGEHATLKTVIANPLVGQQNLETLVVDSNGVETVVPAESLGFNRTPQAWADTSYFTWVARHWPAVPDSDTVTVTRFRFRCADQSAQSGILTVHAPRAISSPDTGDDDPPPTDSPTDPVEWMARRSMMRGLTGTPLGGGPALAIELPTAAQVRVDLFDLSGRRVRTLADRVLPAGATVLPWDGRDEAGQAMPRGVYFARLSGSGLSASARLLLSPR